MILGKRAMRILESIANDESQELWTIKEIAQKMDIAMMEVASEIPVLVEVGALVKQGDGYLLGAMMHRLREKILNDPLGQPVVVVERMPTSLAVVEYLEGRPHEWFREGWEDVPAPEPIVTVNRGPEFYGVATEIHAYQVPEGSTSHLDLCMVLLQEASQIGVFHAPDCGMTVALIQMVREAERQGKKDKFGSLVEMACKGEVSGVWRITWL